MPSDPLSAETRAKTCTCLGIHIARESCRNCHEDDLKFEIECLRGFAQAVMEAWPEYGCDIDGGELQELAAKHGLLKPETRTEPCGEECSCRDYAGEDEFPLECYRKTPLLMGSVT